MDSSEFPKVPEGRLEAQKQFQALLPSLLPEQDRMWICITADGRYITGESMDETEIAGQAQGFDPDEYVVRHISEFELDSDDDNEIEVYLMQCNSRMLSTIS